MRSGFAPTRWAVNPFNDDPGSPGTPLPFIRQSLPNSNTGDAPEEINGQVL